ncbi:MAG: hypothetical protein F4X74_01260 [Acidimicrobiia bacterium]|nr:hypothetical protein [Acidimicrobiia bacterium]
MKLPPTKAFVRVVWLPVVVVVLFAVWLGDRCDVGLLPVYGSLDGPVYESVEELAEKADLIVVGMVTGWSRGKRCATVDFIESIHYKIVGINAEPIAFNTVEVSEILKGEAGATVTLGGYDAQRFVTDNLTPLRPRDEVLLFLSGPVAADKSRYRLSPRTPVPDMYYNTLSNDNGVFDVYAGGRLVIPRLHERFDFDRLPENLAEMRLRILDVVSSSS